MKTETKSRLSATLKLFLVLSVFAGMIAIFSSCGKTKKSEAALTQIAPPPPAPPLPPPVDETKKTEPFQKADVMPKYPGGEAELLKFIGNSITYPVAAKTKGIQGKVIVKFVVDSDGSVNMVSIEKGVDPDLDAEAMRAVKTLPKFEPGLIDGKPVPVWYMVPINFNLQ